MGQAEHPSPGGVDKGGQGRQVLNRPPARPARRTPRWKRDLLRLVSVGFIAGSVGSWALESTLGNLMHEYYVQPREDREKLRAIYIEVAGRLCLSHNLVTKFASDVEGNPDNMAMLREALLSVWGGEPGYLGEFNGHTMLQLTTKARILQRGASDASGRREKAKVDFLVQRDNNPVIADNHQQYGVAEMLAFYSEKFCAFKALEPEAYKALGGCLKVDPGC